MCPFILFLFIDWYASLEHTHCANTFMSMKNLQSFKAPSNKSKTHRLWLITNKNTNYRTFSGQFPVGLRFYLITSLWGITLSYQKYVIISITFYCSQFMTSYNISIIITYNFIIIAACAKHTYRIHSIIQKLL